MKNVPIEDHIPGTVAWQRYEPFDPVELLVREWLVTNGLGGYSSTSLSGACTRRYHGLLVSAFPAPLGRMVMLSHFSEEIVLPDESVVHFSGEEFFEEELHLRPPKYLTEFRLERGLPVWRFDIGECCTIEKRLTMPHRQNTVHITYQVQSTQGPVRLRLRPSLHFRGHESPVNEPLKRPYTVTACDDRYEVFPVDSQIPPLRLSLQGPDAGFVLEGGRFKNIFYRFEHARGYESQGPLWSPGYFRSTLRSGETFAVIVSTEPWDEIAALDSAEAFQREHERRQRLLEEASPRVRSGWTSDLVLAADQFIITPETRVAESARAHASGEEVRTVVAGYHWFTDWGRDTMISLEGLTLTTGRHDEAGCILRTFAHYIRDGLLPNMFPEHEQDGLYHTADATLWYFHALERYLNATGDRPMLKLLLPKLLDVIAHHVRGTRFGIGVDPADGLLRQGAEGYQLTWMDAKVGGWVVTPRRGKAVEINALWYNALRLLEGWVRLEIGDERAQELRDMADRARESFNRRFWYESGGYLYDVIDGEGGDDASIRPNQLFAISLTHPILDESRWKAVVEIAEKHLLTPYGLRSLAPGHPSFKAQYYGDIRARDAAYHQGTVWAWLIGPFIDAWLRTHPDPPGARRFLSGFEGHLTDACVGSVSEIFDASAPFIPRGCCAQAWSVAEVLRCWLKTAP